MGEVERGKERAKSRLRGGIEGVLGAFGRLSGRVNRGRGVRMGIVEASGAHLCALMRLRNRKKGGPRSPLQTAEKGHKKP